MIQKWWWNLAEGRAVASDERPRNLDVLGPYPTRQAAERWSETVEARNEAWTQADEEWEADEDGDGPPGP